jgi:hypothetical protein
MHTSFSLLFPQIPILSPATSQDVIPDDTLVRLRGMVQDMLDPEYYVGEYQDHDGQWHSCRYLDDEGDKAKIQEKVFHNKINGSVKFAERRPLIVVPIPGESKWITDVEERKALESIQAAIYFPTSNKPGDAMTAKRRFEDENTINTEMEVDAQVEMEMGGRKRAAHGHQALFDSKISGFTTDVDIESQPFCMPSYSKGAAFVLLESDLESSHPKLNDIVEIVGILSGVKASGACPLQIPRIHALLIRTIPAFQPPREIQTDPKTIEDTEIIREAVVKGLTGVLAGDELAAEYVLLHLISRVHKRINSSGESSKLSNESAGHSSTLGTMPLNLKTQCEESNLPSVVASVVETLTTKCVGIQLTLQNLNSAAWTPRRPESSPFLTTGLLQISSGTHIVVDETVMEAGSLNEKGLRNLAALQNLIANQQVAYNFEYFDLQQPTDAPVCIVSTGKSLLSKNVNNLVQLLHVPLSSGESVHAMAVQKTLEEIAAVNVDVLREYIARAKAKEATDFLIPQDMVSRLEEDLADARRKEPDVLTEADFHTILNVARLLTISHGETTLRPKFWARAMELERQRRHRGKGLK